MTKQNSKLKEVVFLNGKFLLLADAQIPISDPGFLQGLGLFETMRAYRKNIVYFNQHLRRIYDACRFMGLCFPCSLAQLKDIIKKTVEINGLPDVYVRLTLWEAKERTGTLVIARNYKPHSAQNYRKGFSVGVSRFRLNEHSPLAQIKTTNRIFYEHSFQEAKDKGFQEAVILNNRGFITEASRSNVFLARDKELFTPDLKCGCLEGITRKVIFDLAKNNNIKIYEGNFTIQDLFQADEAFLTNSLLGVMPLTSLEKHKIGKGKIGIITEYFLKKYNLLLKNET
jgi:branched-subunit amino acid aminotransferase/4-amino-4-deoxychorismate lyase